MFEHEHARLCVFASSGHLSDGFSQSHHLTWHGFNLRWHLCVMCFFFCQVRMVAKSFYFYFLSHCRKQTKNISEDLKRKKKVTTVVSPFIHLNSVSSLKEMALLSKRSGKCHLEESHPGTGRRWQICVMPEEGWHWKSWAGIFLARADEQLEIYWPWEDFFIKSNGTLGNLMRTKHETVPPLC